jgi:hypothetical protein
VPFVALIRLDLDEVHQRVLLLFQQRERERNAQQPALTASIFNGCSLEWLLLRRPPAIAQP